MSSPAAVNNGISNLLAIDQEYATPAIVAENCLQQNSINQAMNALSARPSSAKKTTAGASDNKH